MEPNVQFHFLSSFTGVKHLAVSGHLNFLPWLEKIVPSFLAGPNPRRWIMEGQRMSHAEYQRIIDEIAQGNRRKEEEEGFTNITEAYLAAREEDDGLTDRQQFT